MTPVEEQTPHPRPPVWRWAVRTWIGLRLLGRFAVEMVVSNLAQARLIASPSLDVDPHWVDFRTRLRTPSARVFLGALVSMTPGTLTCDLRGDWLRIHVLGIDSDTNVAQRIRERFESLLEQMEAV